MTQCEIFQPRAKSNDPITSYLAAEHVEKSGMARRQQDAVLIAVRSRPGATSQELATELGQVLDRYVFARRLPELERRGLVMHGEKRRCTISGMKAMTWYPSWEREGKGETA